MQIHLNGNDITNREQLHDALSEALELPEWYGRSLDALYDCLTDLSVPTTIHMENWPEEDYMQRALAVLRDAAEENELLQVRLEDCPSLCRVYHRAPRISRPSAISRAQNTGLRKSRLLPRMQKHTMPGMVASHDEARYDQ